jgi:hypothetical protein
MRGTEIEKGVEIFATEDQLHEHYYAMRRGNNSEDMYRIIYN